MIDQPTPEILLSGAESYGLPILSPAGDRLLYTMLATADRSHPFKWRLMSTPLEGGSRSVVLTGDYTYHCGYLPGARCVLGEDKGHQLVFSTLDPVEGKGTEIQRLDTHPEAEWSLSPDGNKIAIADWLGRSGEVRILTLSDRKVVTLLLQPWKWEMVGFVGWSADESHLFATAMSGTSVALLLVDLHGKLQVLEETSPNEGLIFWTVASPDGRYVAYSKRIYESNVMMLEHF
jgi:WD40-like Beta Propeller Repeat